MNYVSLIEDVEKVSYHAAPSLNSAAREGVWITSHQAQPVVAVAHFSVSVTTEAGTNDSIRDGRSTTRMLDARTVFFPASDAVLDVLPVDLADEISKVKEQIAKEKAEKPRPSWL